MRVGILGSSDVAGRRCIAAVIVLSVLALVVASSNSLHASGPDGTQVQSEKAHIMKLKITVGGKALTATLAKNETARDFVSVLPLTLSTKDLFGREKYAALPKALSEKGPRTRKYAVGDIAYWSPSHDIAIYYHDDGESIPSPGIIPMAKIDGDAEAFNVTGTVKVTIELAK